MKSTTCLVGGAAQAPHVLPEADEVAPDRVAQLGVPGRGVGLHLEADLVAVGEQLDVGVRPWPRAAPRWSPAARRLDEGAADALHARAGRPPGTARACSGTARRCTAARCPRAWRSRRCSWRDSRWPRTPSRPPRSPARAARPRSCGPASRVLFTAMPIMLLIDLSVVNREANVRPRAPASLPLFTARRRPLAAAARTRTNAPTGAGRQQLDLEPVGPSPCRHAIASSSAAVRTPACAAPGAPWWSCLTKKRPSTTPSRALELELEPEQVGLAAAEAELVVGDPASLRHAGRAARSAGCRRGGSTATRWACRCARARRTRPPSSAGRDPQRARALLERRRGRTSRCRSRPSDSTDSPSGNCSGSTPMPTRFERWMRS